MREGEHRRGALIGRNCLNRRGSLKGSATGMRRCCCCCCSSLKGGTACTTVILYERHSGNNESLYNSDLFENLTHVPWMLRASLNKKKRRVREKKKKRIRFEICAKRCRILLWASGASSSGWLFGRAAVSCDFEQISKLILVASNLLSVLFYATRNFTRNNTNDLWIFVYTKLTLDFLVDKIINSIDRPDKCI